MSLAQEFLADLATDASDQSASEHPQELQPVGEMDAGMDMSPQVATSAYQLAPLITSNVLANVLKRIEELQGKTVSISGLVEDDPEYTVIVDANKILPQLDDNIMSIHTFVKLRYKAKFPELEQLVLKPVDYVKTVLAIGNEMDVTKVDLKAILLPATVMIVTVSASTTNGRELSEPELQTVREACDLLLKLDEARKTILKHVETRMNYIAPNLTMVLGSAACAAKLIGIAGGLTALCKIPACNVQVLGAANAKNNLGLSAASVYRHAGLIYTSEIVSKQPMDMRVRAARIVAAKCLIAARVDRCHEHSDGSLGRKLAEEIERKLEKLQEPPPTKNPKALPVPDEQSKKRRGGRKFRKRREALQQTELRKQQNRLAFGVEAEEEIFGGDETEGLGMAGSASGRIRVNADRGKKLGVSAAMQRRLKMLGSSGNVSGLASSLAFTPVQGFELENPEAKRHKASSDKYFGESARFSSK